MSTPTPTKKWASRMGGVMRRASTVLINPARPGTPEQERGSSTDIERSEDDTASTTGKKPKRSRSNTSLSNIFTRSASPPPPQPGAPAAGAAHQPSPIAESPAREAAASQDDPAPPPAPGAVKSPLSQEVTLATTADPDPAAAPQPQPQTAGASPTPAEYIPPPLIDNTAAGPGAFTDDVDDLPSSDPIPDPYRPPRSRSRSPGPPVERAASEETDPQSLAPTAQNSTDLLASSSGGEQESAADKSAPIDIPRERGTFFEHIRSSPEDHDDVVPPPTTRELDLESEEHVEHAPEQPVDQPEHDEQQAPRTPPRQVYIDTYTEELDHEPWSGGEPAAGQRSVEETPMSIPPRPMARSLTGSDISDEDVPANRALEIGNPFDDPVAPRLPPQHGNGYVQPSRGGAMAGGALAGAAVAGAAMAMTMPTPLVASNSKSKAVPPPKFLDNPKPYGAGADSDTDESRPLIRHKPSKTGNPSSYTTFANPTFPLSGRYAFAQHESSTPPRLRENGWVEVHLPDSYVYYVNPTARIVADVEMRTDRLFHAVSRHLELEQHKDAMEGAPEGAELWLRDAGSVKKGFVPVRWWVIHKEREVVFDRAFEGALKRKVLKKKKEDEDQLDLEYRYWAFVEAHPSHVVLEARAKQEAYEAINWAMTERLLPSQSPIPAPFSQEECGTLLDLLNRFDNDKNRQVDTAIQTRTIARILLRVAQWRQQHFRANKPLPKDVTAQTAKAPTYRRPFPRVLLDFTISLLCLGIPYFFLDRSRDHRVDEESGLRTAAPMFVIGACTCIMASIILSASVTFLTLSGLDSLMRIAGFVALISAIFSMASTLLAIFTIKADLERPPQVIGGEGLLMLSRRSVVMSLPVVFLLYSIIGFVTGVVLFSLRGVSITDVHLVRRPFSEYTRWTAAGALGAIAGMITVTVLLFKR